METSKATQTLPDNYQLSKILDLIKEPKLLLSLSLFSIVLFIGAWVGLGWLLQWLRPDINTGGFSLTFEVAGLAAILTPFLVILGVTAVMIFVHEAIHGIFFRVYTGGKVKFAFKGAYAYAAAPGWYIPKKPYMVVSLAPLVLMTVGGVLALVWVPANWVIPIMLLVAMNAAGAVGDIYVFWLLTRMAEDVFIRDFGERMNIYTPGVEGGVEQGEAG